MPKMVTDINYAGNQGYRQQAVSNRQYCWHVRSEATDFQNFRRSAAI
jgi:hypothetical protein